MDERFDVGQDWVVDGYLTSAVSLAIAGLVGFVGRWLSGFTDLEESFPSPIATAVDRMGSLFFYGALMAAIGLGYQFFRRLTGPGTDRIVPLALGSLHVILFLAVFLQAGRFHDVLLFLGTAACIWGMILVGLARDGRRVAAGSGLDKSPS